MTNEEFPACLRCQPTCACRVAHDDGRERCHKFSWPPDPAARPPALTNAERQARYRAKVREGRALVSPAAAVAALPRTAVARDLRRAANLLAALGDYFADVADANEASADALEGAGRAADRQREREEAARAVAEALAAYADAV